MKLNNTDAIIIIGIETFLGNFKSPKIAEMKFGVKSTGSHMLENENWNIITNALDDLYCLFQNKVFSITTIVRADIYSRVIIVDRLKESNNMSIYSSEPISTDENSVKIQHYLYEIIINNDYSKAFEEINKYKDQMNDEIYDFVLIALYQKNQCYKDATYLLEKYYNTLQEMQKLALADMYIEISEFTRAEEILLEIESHNKYCRNLYTSFLKLYNKTKKEKYKEYIMKAVEIDPNNIAIIESYASYLSSNKEYKKAADMFRRLSIEINQEYYELIARINEFLEDNGDGKASVNYIFECVNNPKYINEAALRLSVYFDTEKHSDFLSYDCLRRAVLDYKYSNSLEVVKKMINIFKDTNRASRALGKLKPHKKENDARTIINKRGNLLIESIPILASEGIGYLFWKDFMNSQSDKQWLDFAYDYLSKSELFGLDYDAYINCSTIYKYLQTDTNLPEGVLDDKDSIVCYSKEIWSDVLNKLERFKNGDQDVFEIYEDFEFFISTIITPAEVSDNWEMKIVFRYYISIIAANLGLFQDANNNALCILEYCKLIDDENTQRLSLFLGLLAWGNSQYRLGRKHEGILCVISSIKYCLLSKEIYPFIKDGLSIITLFLVDCSFKEKDKDKWIEFSKKIQKYDDSYMFSLLLFKYGTTEDIVENAIDLFDRRNEKKIYGIKYHEICYYSRLGMVDKAINIIQHKYKNIIAESNVYRDGKSQYLYELALILLNEINDKNVNIAYQLISVALENIEKLRMLVYHKAERAALSEQSRKILKLYIDICFLRKSFKCENENNKIDEIIKEIIGKLSPRTISEQKNGFLLNISSEIEQLEKEYREEYLGKR